MQHIGLNSVDAFNGKMENDFTQIDLIMQHIGLKTIEIVVSVLRFGRVIIENGEKRKCKHLIVSSNNSQFL